MFQESFKLAESIARKLWSLDLRSNSSDLAGAGSASKRASTDQETEVDAIPPCPSSIGTADAEDSTHLRNTPLPLPPFVVGESSSFSSGDDDWNIIQRGYGHKTIQLTSTVDHEPAMRVDYVGGSVGSHSGFGFHASPSSIFPTEAVGLSYWVYFPKDFEWKKGGKLPGLYIGAPGATGGDWSSDSGSARVIFKEGGKAAAYIYIPCQVASCGTKDGVVEAQDPQYRSISNVTSTKGHHIWKTGKAKFKAGNWNAVRIWIRLNTPGKKDGELGLEVNGVLQKYDKMVWRSHSGVKVGGINCVSFFGGNSPQASAPTGAFAAFKSFAIQTVCA